MLVDIHIPGIFKEL